jgi:hypothetical protein
MSEEVLIVKVLTLLWLANVCEVVSFLIVHFVTSTSTTFIPPIIRATIAASKIEVKLLAHLVDDVSWLCLPFLLTMRYLVTPWLAECRD